MVDIVFPERLDVPLIAPVVDGGFSVAGDFGNLLRSQHIGIVGEHLAVFQIGNHILLFDFAATCFPVRVLAGDFPALEMPPNDSICTVRCLTAEIRSSLVRMSDTCFFRL